MDSYIFEGFCIFKGPKKKKENGNAQKNVSKYSHKNNAVYR